MMLVQCMLAMQLGAYVKWLPMAVAILCGVILLIAFFIGFGKGGRKVSWGGLVWLAAGVAFFLVDKYLGAKNPLIKLLTEKGFTANVVAFASSFSIMLVCVLAVLLLYGVFALFLRPKTKWVKRTDDLYTKDEYGIEYDDDYHDYDDYENYQSRKVPVRKGYGKPSIAGRLLGGLICMVNTAMVLAVVVGSALFIVSSTALKDGVLAAMFENRYVGLALEYAARFALDLAIVGIIVLIACAGNKAGLVETLRVLIVNFGSIALVGISFYLPFSKFAAAGSPAVLSVLMTRCANAAVSLGLSAGIAVTVGKILAGVLLALVVVLAIVLLNWLLKLAVRGIKKNGFLKGVDGVLSCLVYTVIGVALCAVIWALLYVLSYYGIFYAGGLTTGETCLSKGLFETFDLYLKPWLEKAAQMLSSLL